MIAAPILPYVLLAAVSATSVAGLGGYLWGRSDGRALEAGQQVADEALIATVATAAQTAAAREIAGIEIKNTTIRQTVESKTRENTVYRDCRHADGVLDLVNAALTGTQPAGGGQLPVADSGAGRELRGDHHQAGGRGDSVPAVPDGGAGREP